MDFVMNAKFQFPSSTATFQQELKVYQSELAENAKYLQSELKVLNIMLESMEGIPKTAKPYKTLRLQLNKVFYYVMMMESTLNQIKSFCLEYKKINLSPSTKEEKYTTFFRQHEVLSVANKLQGEGELVDYENCLK
ncbi:uncharacterized protein LOC119683334 [Teleopsis dalmanni]|uniref:uncharacterized protein LOC119683334 n=1 Tax=Teleopsis dalmanni TaxID=139649 RepID=UPI0018CCB852|nr:uncharacterized protein LOC119683334 [Teleopsis dalmanni]